MYSYVLYVELLRNSYTRRALSYHTAIPVNLVTVRYNFSCQLTNVILRTYGPNPRTPCAGTVIWYVRRDGGQHR